MRLSLRLWLASVLVLTQLVSGALCWGKEGHYTVCKIAEGYFEDDTIAAVKKLLPESAEGDLAAFCSWPDVIKHLSQWKWTSVLHYVNTPEYRCNYEYCRDCHDANKHKDWCVTGAIFNYTNQLISASKNSQSLVHYNLTEALMFLSHYMGDVHQPLHTGFLGDLGGNTIIVKWYHHKTNLHNVWDNMIIETALETYYNSSLPSMIQSLQSKLKNGWSNDVPSWESCQLNKTACPNQYASESIDLACKYAYRNATPGTTLGDDYFLSRLPVVEKRLAQGGIRLAATLNRIFSAKPKLAGS
ncbi:PREDICTED: endonuclease 5 isoform X2 [Camelina sativa]|uniref:Aspergillus nuclease S1 n=1 Tax=Camelina sativa TaxID=90675 RepID=A0ABM0U0Q9_CAMSA|nr:PREDICTED: endonuclease 5 isoform X2 [Camelina sativa]